MMMVLLKDPSLVLSFSHYTLMTFLMMLSAILISLLMVLLSIQRFNQPSQIAYNVLFPIQTDFPIRSRYVDIMFSLTFKAFVIFMTFLQFQSTLEPSSCMWKNSVPGDLFKTKKTLNRKPPDPPLHFMWHTAHLVVGSNRWVAPRLTQPFILSSS